MLDKIIKLFHDIRPNAAWDFIKWGAAAMIASFLAIGYWLLQLYRDAPFSVVVMIAIFLISFFFIIVLYSYEKLSKSKSESIVKPGEKEKLEIVNTTLPEEGKLRNFALSNIELKRQAQQLCDDMLRFAEDQETNNSFDLFNFNSNRQPKDPNSPAAIKRANQKFARQAQESIERSNKVRNDFTQRFGVRYTTIKKELEKRGANPRDIEDFEIIHTNPYTIKRAAIQISAIANLLPDNE